MGALSFPWWAIPCDRCRTDGTVRLQTHQDQTAVRGPMRASGEYRWHRARKSRRRGPVVPRPLGLGGHRPPRGRSLRALLGDRRGGVPHAGRRGTRDLRCRAECLSRYGSGARFSTSPFRAGRDVGLDLDLLGPHRVGPRAGHRAISTRAPVVGDPCTVVRRWRPGSPRATARWLPARRTGCTARYGATSAKGGCPPR
jgi:hypothetical protein